MHFLITLHRICIVSALIMLKDEDLNAMYLSDKKNGIFHQDDHEELEVLLESFSKQVEEIVNEAENIEVRCLSICAYFNFHGCSYGSLSCLEQCAINARDC